MARKTIFLETAFWDKFSECSRSLEPYADGNDPVQVFNKITQWYNIYSFFCRSSLYVDTPLSELAEKAKDDPMLAGLLQCNGDGEMDLEYQQEPFPVLESDDAFEYDDDYSSVFFTAEDHRKDARKHGVINVCMESIWNQEKKFIDSGDAIKTDEGWTWNSLDIIKENSNGMVIIDNFILSPDNLTGKCTIRYDLRELMRQMLPDPNTYKEEYIISIFYYENSDEQVVRDARKKQYFQSITDFVKAKKPKLKLKLELFPTFSNQQNYHKDFHDRTIVTNNIWLGSEAGFDLLVPDYTRNTNTRVLKTTKVHSLYLGFGFKSARWLEHAYEHLITEARQCLKKYNYTTENRILLSS